MERPLISKVFLLMLIAAVAYGCFLVFRPFLSELLVAVILVSIFYRPYEWLARKLGGRQKLAAAVMCIVIVLLVLVPMVNLIIYGAQRSVIAYDNIVEYLSSDQAKEVARSPFVQNLRERIFQDKDIKEVVIEVAKKIQNWFLSGATSAIRSTTSFIIATILIIFSMFFFFIDGRSMLEKITRLTPLPNKYDQEIFKKFRDVSYSTILSTFVTAIAQALIGALGLAIVGLPVFFLALLMGFFSLLPYVGAGFVWLPAAVYLLFTGQIWQGIFLIVWGGLVVSTVDNLVRAYIIKGKAEVHPLFIIFSILGGIALFGFWGVVFGPLIISLAVTVMHIYELEYDKVLEK